MDYRSEVFAAIAGGKKALDRMIEHISILVEEEQKDIFSCFKLIELEKNFWIYVFYDGAINWSNHAKKFWRMLYLYAENFTLGYLFYRIGKEDTDIESMKYNIGRYNVLLESAALFRDIDLHEKLRAAFYR